MSLIPIVQGGHSVASGFDSTLIPNSAIFDGSADYLTRTPGSAGNRTRWTLAWWFQLNAISTDMTFFSANSGSNDFYIRMDGTSSQQITVHDDSASGSMKTVAMQRDIGWYHCIVSLDTNESSATDRLKIYINGEQQELTTHGSAGTYNSSGTTYWNNNQNHEIGRRSRTTSSYANAYMAQILFLDGDSTQNSDVSVNDILDTSTSFGSNGSQRIPKKGIESLATTAGGNSFLLDFANSSNLGNDISGNSPSGENDFTVQGGMGSANQSSNTPSLVYPRVNVARPAISGKSFTDGALKVSSTSGFGQGNVLTTFPLSTGGYWYWEIIDAAASANQTYGIAKEDAGANASGLGGDTKAWGFYNNQYRHNGNIGAVPDSPTNGGTRYMFAVNVDAGKFFMGADGTWWKPVGGSTAGDPAAGTNPAFTDADIAEGDTFPAMDLWSSDSATFVFDEDDFAHSIPTGFLPLKSSNLTTPTHQGCDQFSAVTYTGNGSTRSITTDIAPAWVWIKNRSQGDEHKLVDIVRGATKELSSDDASNSEQTDSNGVTSFSSSSFALGSGPNGYNDNTENFIAWCFEAGTAFSNDASATGIGTLDSSGRVNASDSLSIISYTGNNTDNASFKHGLSGAPELVIHRERDNANGWLVGATVVGYDQMLRLDTGDGDTADADAWSDVAPSSSIITLGAGNGTNRAGAMICFAMRSVPGVSKIGTYVGNGSGSGTADGPYVSCGFRPAIVFQKWVTGGGLSGENWIVKDTTRQPLNENRTDLSPSSAGAESTGATHGVDMLADGFKLRGGGGGNNQSGAIYLFAAFSDLAGNGTLPPIYGR